MESYNQTMRRRGCPCGFMSRENCLYLKLKDICREPKGEPPPAKPDKPVRPELEQWWAERNSTPPHTVEQKGDQ